MQLDCSGRPVRSNYINISIVLDADGAKTLGQGGVDDGNESQGERQQQLHLDNAVLAVKFVHRSDKFYILLSVGPYC